MRALANYVMSGRQQAVMVALIGTWIPLLTQATLSLVTLRKGWQQGLIVTLWASTPAILVFGLELISLAEGMISVAVIYLALLLSWVLRYTVSWPAVLSSLIALSSLAGVVVVLFSSDVVQNIEDVSKVMIDGLKSEQGESLFSPAELSLLTEWTSLRASGAIGLLVGVQALFGLLIARWWQALLYNPGGFRSEFHSLRLNQSIGLVCIGAVAYCNIGGVDYHFWGQLFSLPLFIAGLGLVHFMVARWNLGVFPLVIFYVLLPGNMTLLVGAVSLIGFTDVWLDYRRRFNLTQQ